jgi:hypothetical protein
VDLAESDSDDASPSKLVVRSYAAVVSFISVIVMVVMVLALVWAVLGSCSRGVRSRIALERHAVALGRSDRGGGVCVGLHGAPAPGESSVIAADHFAR